MEYMKECIGRGWDEKGWMVRGGQEQEGAWAAKRGEDGKSTWYNSQVFESTQKCLDSLVSRE